jgi:hypothetical protein
VLYDEKDKSHVKYANACGNQPSFSSIPGLNERAAEKSI